MGRIIERVFCAKLQTRRRWLIAAVMALTEHCETEAVISPRRHLEGIRRTVLSCTRLHGTTVDRRRTRPATESSSARRTEATTSKRTRITSCSNWRATTRIVRRVARRAGVAKPIRPHTLRHAFITAALDAGVPLRDVQEAASHADPRTTMRYDRARVSLDRHATYIVATYIAGAAR